MKVNPSPIPLHHFQVGITMDQERPLTNDIGLACFVCGEARNPDLNKGVVNLYQRDLIVTGNFWKIVNLDLKWYRTQLDLVDIILKQVETFQEKPQVANTGCYITQQEIKYLYAVWAQINSEFRDVEKLLPIAHQKRGLFNFGGEVLNFLFGTATNAELRTLHQAVEDMKEQQVAIAHSLEHQLTYTKELDEKVRQNTRDVTFLARILKLQVSNFLKLNETVSALEGNFMHQLERMANASQNIRELEFLYCNLNKNLSKLGKG